MHRKSTRTAVAALLIALTLTGCAKKASTPSIPPLTPEQKVALAKIGTQTAAAGLNIAIDKANREGKASKARILTICRDVLNEFNVQVADVTVIDLTNRATVRAAITKALSGADNLIAGDVANLNDPTLQAEIRGVIAIVRSALASFDVLVPVQ